MTRVFEAGSIIATASFAASSGRQRMATSTEFRSSRRAAGSLRRSGSIDTSVTSERFCNRSRIWRPVVPASPSMKMLVMRRLL